MLRLIQLPYEVLANIIDNIDFDDVLSVGSTCKALNYVLTEESICKVIVQVRSEILRCGGPALSDPIMDVQLLI